MSDRKYLLFLTALTSHMRRETLIGRRYHLLDLARETAEDGRVVEDFLAEALKSDYRDEQLEIFCSLITSTVWPKDMNSATIKFNQTVPFPPPKIFAALSQYPLEKVYEMIETEDGRALMTSYIQQFWITARDVWLERLDNQLHASGLARTMNTLYPKKTANEALVDRIMDGLLGNAPQDPGFRDLLTQVVNKQAG